MSTTTQVQASGAGTTTTNSPVKNIESWWTVSKTSGKHYVMYEDAAGGAGKSPAILSNEGLNIPGLPPFERLVPDHIEKGVEGKDKWEAPYGITYVLWETEDEKTHQKKAMIFRNRTEDMKKQGGGGNWKKGQWPQKAIVDQMTVVQAINLLQSPNLSATGNQAFECAEVTRLLSKEGGGWKVPQTTGVEFKQTLLDTSTMTMYIVYTLVQKESNITSK